MATTLPGSPAPSEPALPEPALLLAPPPAPAPLRRLRRGRPRLPDRARPQYPVLQRLRAVRAVRVVRVGDRPQRDRRARRGRRAVWLLVAAVAVGGVLRVAIGLTDHAPASDETAYLTSGESLVEGQGFGREGRPELHFPPFVPFLMGTLGRIVGDGHTAAVWLTAASGTAVLVPLSLLARRLAGPRAGVATAWVAALAPGLATMPATRGTGSENEYTLLVVTAVWLVVTGADRHGGARLGRVAGAGLLLGLAYLTRPEGLLVALPVGAAAVLLARRHHRQTRHLRRPWRTVPPVGAAFVVPLLACVVPYAAYLHEHTGSWRLTAKTQDVSLEAWDAVARGDRHARDQILYALDDTGLRFADDRSSLVSLARDDPGGYLGILATNVRTLLVNVAGVSLLPLPLWVLAGYGAWRWRRSAVAWLVLAVGIMPVATALAFFVQPRYLVVTTALATVVAGGGWEALRAHAGRAMPAVPVVLVVALVLLAGSSLQAFHGDAGWGRPADHTDQRRAGEWLAAHTEPTDRIMTRSMVVWYYAERPTVAPPYADLDEIVAFARHYGTRYLVVDSSHAEGLRPQLVPLLTRDGTAGLRLVHEARAEGRTTRVFALDPPPPPTDAVGPSLGFMGDGAA